ncbi:MAG: InlB B-repeat-containing protein, partial [Clostridia bacterium]
MKKSKMRVLFVMLAMLVATLSACSANGSFKINFEVDGVQYGSIDTDGGATIALPADPTKTGYTFDGWYFDKDVWQQPLTIYSFLHAKLTSNLTVYAKWLEKFDVIFEVNGGSAVASQSVVGGSFATAPAAPTKTKFSFVGWYKEASCTTAFDFATEKITADTTVYAKWLEKFDVIFEVNGGSAVASQSVVGGSFATA